MQAILNDEFGELKAVLLNKVSVAANACGFEGNLAALNFQLPSFSVQKIKQAWQLAAFSELPDHSLRRYFSYHLEGIREILDTFFFQKYPGAGLNETAFVDLINYQRQYFRAYFDLNLLAPAVYRNQLINVQNKAIESAISLLSASDSAPAMKVLILDYIRQMTTTDHDLHDTYHTLFYFENFILELNKAELTKSGSTARLNELLTELNFNHLGYLAYRRHEVGEAIYSLSPVESLEFLQQAQTNLITPGITAPIYDSEWPPLTSMLDAYLGEQIRMTEKQIKRTEQRGNIVLEKLHFNLSVAQLAFFTKLFFEENHLNISSLTEVFKFICRNYATKRQQSISPGSLSKEYYSTTQVTAAVVREMLQKMIARINRTFFPVLAVISTAVHFYPGIH